MPGTSVTGTEFAQGEIVVSFFVFVRQHVVSLGHFLEALLGVFVIGMAVRMELLRHLKVSLFDRFRVGVAFNAQDFVPILCPIAAARSMEAGPKRPR